MITKPASLFETGAVVLGYVGRTAAWCRPTAGNEVRVFPTVVVQSCSDTDEGTHTPASSVTITGREALMALRDAINSALNEGAAS